MTQPVNGQIPSQLPGQQPLQGSKTGTTGQNYSSGAAKNEFSQLLSTLVMEEQALLQTQLSGISAIGGGSNISGGSMPGSNLTSALLSMMLNSGSTPNTQSASGLSSGANALYSPTAAFSPQTAVLSASAALSRHHRNQEISQAVSSAAKQYNLPENLLKAVIHQESGGNPTATSTAGAMGLMQLMPSTAARLGVQDPYSIQDNIHGGAKYLSELLHQFNGNVPLALAGYNAGPQAVLHYGGIPPYQETQNYVKNILTSLSVPSAAQQSAGQFLSDI